MLKSYSKISTIGKRCTNGDPVLVENYLQHADHYSRRLADLNAKNKNNSENKSSVSENVNTKETI